MPESLPISKNGPAFKARGRAPSGAGPRLFSTHFAPKRSCRQTLFAGILSLLALPFSLAPVLLAQAPASPAPDAGPIAKRILSFFGKLPPQCQIASGTAGINAFAGVDTNDCSTKRPDTDNADKGDFRFNYQQSEMASLRRV